MPPSLFGALIVYTLVNTVLRGLLLGTPAPVFDAPELPPQEALPEESTA